MNDAFSYLELANHHIVSDLGIQGIVKGLGVASNTQRGLVVVAGPGLAYDALGRRVRLGTSYPVDCANTSESTPTAVITPGHERWLSIGVTFARHRSKAVRDENNRLIHTRDLESFKFVVQAGEDGASGNAIRPPPDANVVHLCDLRLRYEQDEICEQDIDLSRRRELRLWKAKHIEARSDAWKALPSAALDSVLDAIDAALIDLRGVGARLVRGDRWQTLPQSTTVQASLDGVDTELTLHVQRLQALQNAIDVLIRRHYPKGRRVVENIVLTVSVSVPAIRAEGTWVMAARIDGFRPGVHRVLSALPAGSDGPPLEVTLVRYINDGIRLRFRNDSSTSINAHQCDLDVLLAILEPRP